MTGEVAGISLLKSKGETRVLNNQLKKVSFLNLVRDRDQKTVLPNLSIQMALKHLVINNLYL